MNDRTISEAAKKVCELFGHAVDHHLPLPDENQISKVIDAAARVEPTTDRVLIATKNFLKEAIVLSDDYLETFKDWPDDKTVLGWEKARWVRALNAKKALCEAIDNTSLSAAPQQRDVQHKREARANEGRPGMPQGPCQCEVCAATEETKTDEQIAEEICDQAADIAFTPPMPLKFNCGKLKKFILAALRQKPAAK